MYTPIHVPMHIYRIYMHTRVCTHIIFTISGQW